MLEFDKYVTTELKEIVEKESAIRSVVNRNDPTRKKKLVRDAVSGRYKRIRYRITTLQKRISKTDYKKEQSQKEIYANLQRKKLLAKLKRNQMKTAYNDFNRNKLRLHYTRYADDWIILSNFPVKFAEKIKKHIEIWLRDNLRATLSMEKTKITILTKESAKFLGFELRIPSKRKGGTLVTQDGNKYQTRTPGWKILCYPDNDRLINRLHMKGYCNKNGKPKSLPWLSTLESFIIIEKYNAVMRGMANYYAEFIHNKIRLYRWLYVIKYS